MLHEASFSFLMAGVISIIVGSAALIGGSLPLATLARWSLPIALVAIGLAGLSRVWRRSS